MVILKIILNPYNIYSAVGKVTLIKYTIDVNIIQLIASMLQQIIFLEIYVRSRVLKSF